MNPATVLVVEDHAPTREAFAELLDEAGYRVIEASNGGEAIMQVRRHDPDVVVMEEVLPVVDGFEAAESLREYPVTAGIPILGLAGSANRMQRERMQRACDALLLKPCTPEELLTQVHALASRRVADHLSLQSTC